MASFGVIARLQRIAPCLERICAAICPGRPPSTGADAIAQDFAREVNAAADLLSFMLTAGHPYHIPDQIIDDIEASRELVKNSSPTTPADRAKLLKAYRDLVAIPQTSVTFNGIPPTGFWNLCSRWPWLLLILGVIPALIISYCYNWYYSVSYFVAFSLIIWGFYAFTGIVSDRKLNEIIALSYIYTILAIAFSILPWSVPGVFEDGHLRLVEPTKAPVSILLGCTVNPTITPDNKSAPGDIGCATDNTNYQWVINLGGSAENFPASGVSSGATPSTPSTAAPSTAKHYKIRGGIVLPLYVIILALFGGAVSMTRRVPEYQRRAMSTEEALTNQEARENLVFQLMQVISAPLIAIAAYYIYKPGTTTESVVLGFGSGFASEPILLMIRSLVEKLSPAEAPKPSLIAVRVDPPSVSVQAGKSQQFSAKVTGSTNAEVTWLIAPADGSAGTISQSGNYVAPKTVAANMSATVTACSVADRTKSGSANVTVTP